MHSSHFWLKIVAASLSQDLCQIFVNMSSKLYKTVDETITYIQAMKDACQLDEAEYALLLESRQAINS